MKTISKTLNFIDFILDLGKFNNIDNDEHKIEKFYIIHKNSH